MNIKQLTELTTYLNTLSEDDQDGITIGACFEGYIFIEDYFGNVLDSNTMFNIGYVYIGNCKWYALEGELPA